MNILPVYTITIAQPGTLVKGYLMQWVPGCFSTPHNPVNTSPWICRDTLRSMRRNWGPWMKSKGLWPRMGKKNAYLSLLSACDSVTNGEHRHVDTTWQSSDHAHYLLTSGVVIRTATGACCVMPRWRSTLLWTVSVPAPFLCWSSNP